MKTSSVILIAAASLCLAVGAWGQTQVTDHYSLQNLQGFGGVEQSDGRIVRLQVDHFEQRDGSFAINIWTYSEHWENYELVSGLTAYPQNVPEQYVKANENYIIVDIPDVTQITGDFNCNGVYGDPSACPQPMPIKAIFKKNPAGSTSESGCHSHEFGENLKYFSGGGSGYNVATLEGNVLEGEIDPSLQIGGWSYIYFWNQKVKAIHYNK